MLTEDVANVLNGALGKYNLPVEVNSRRPCTCILQSSVKIEVIHIRTEEHTRDRDLEIARNISEDLQWSVIQNLMSFPEYAPVGVNLFSVGYVQDPMSFRFLVNAQYTFILD